MVICNINFNRLPKTELNWSERNWTGPNALEVRKKELGNFIDVGWQNLTGASFIGRKFVLGKWTRHLTSWGSFSELYEKQADPLATVTSYIKTDSSRISILVMNLIHEIYSR